MTQRICETLIDCVNNDINRSSQNWFFNPFPTDLIFMIFRNTRLTCKNVKNQLYAFLRSI